MKTCDAVVIGAGIVGLATAYRLLEREPSLDLVVLEKESSPGAHQTGHNSGVIHSGIYYRPGSLKARLCVEGAQALVDFCRDHSIPFEICGKIVAATDALENGKGSRTFFRRGNRQRRCRHEGTFRRRSPIHGTPTCAAFGLCGSPPRASSIFGR